MNSVDLDPTNTLVVTGTMDGKGLVIISIAFISIFTQPASFPPCPSLKESETVTIFKKKLKTFLFRDYFNR